MNITARLDFETISQQKSKKDFFMSYDQGHKMLLKPFRWQCIYLIWNYLYLKYQK